MQPPHLLPRSPLRVCDRDTWWSEIDIVCSLLYWQKLNNEKQLCASALTFPTNFVLSLSLTASVCVFSFNNNFMHNFALFYWPSFALCNVFLYLFNSLGLVSWLLACLRWRWWCWQLYLNLTLARIFFAFWQIHLQRLLIHFVFAYLIDVSSIYI